MIQVAVVLSGCGVYDGTEIHEAVLTLLALDRAGVRYACLAPNMPQMHVVNHLNGEVAADETRNVLVESARIARGQVIDIAEADPARYDAAIFPGGFGAAKNLCDFALRGSDCAVQPDVLRFARGMASAGKPLGFVCIAPAIIPRVFDEPTRLTIGSDAQTAQALEAMGGVHVRCPVGEFVVDEEHRLVTTPAYMLAERISEAAEGIEKLVAKVLELAAQG